MDIIFVTSVRMEICQFPQFAIDLSLKTYERNYVMQFSSQAISLPPLSAVTESHTETLRGQTDYQSTDHRA